MHYGMTWRPGWNRKSPIRELVDYPPATVNVEVVGFAGFAVLARSSSSTTISLLSGFRWAARSSPVFGFSSTPGCSGPYIRYRHAGLFLPLSWRPFAQGCGRQAGGGFKLKKTGHRIPYILLFLPFNGFSFFLQRRYVLALPLGARRHCIAVRLGATSWIRRGVDGDFRI